MEDQSEEQARTEEQNKKKLQLLEQFASQESFKVWRDWVAVPMLSSLEAKLNGPEVDQMSEAVLRGSLKHYFSMKALYYEIFEQAKSILDSQREQERQDAQITNP